MKPVNPSLPEQMGALRKNFHVDPPEKIKVGAEAMNRNTPDSNPSQDIPYVDDLAGLELAKPGEPYFPARHKEKIVNLADKRRNRQTNKPGEPEKFEGTHFEMPLPGGGTYAGQADDREKEKLRQEAFEFSKQNMKNQRAQLWGTYFQSFFTLAGTAAIVIGMVMGVKAASKGQT